MFDKIYYEVEMFCYTKVIKYDIVFPDRITGSTTNKIAAQMKIDHVLPRKKHGIGTSF